MIIDVLNNRRTVQKSRSVSLVWSKSIHILARYFHMEILMERNLPRSDAVLIDGHVTVIYGRYLYYCPYMNRAHG